MRGPRSSIPSPPLPALRPIAVREALLRLSRRSLLTRATCGAAFSLASPRAQAYPARPVKIIVGFGPGGAPDIAARLMAQWLSDRLGQPFVVEIRGGAGG